MTEYPDLPPLERSLLRIVLRLVMIAAIVFAVHRLLGWMMYVEEGLEQPNRVIGGLLILALLAYALLIAIPFVPGIEIGVTLMMIRGAEIVPYVYTATVAGLLLAYFAGRLLPYDWLHRVFLDLRLRRACALLTSLKPLSQERRLALLRSQMPWRLGEVFVHARHVALALLINLPGNALIGGGGGICLIAGLSRLYSNGWATLTILLAVAPVPLVVWLYGASVLSP